MASLKDLRNRIRSVRSTQKITSAMKMVAASRLRRAQEQAEAARPYAQRMEQVLSSLAGRMACLLHRSKVGAVQSSTRGTRSRRT